MRGSICCVACDRLLASDDSPERCHLRSPELLDAHESHHRRKLPCLAVGFTNSTCCDGLDEWCETCGGRTSPLIGTAGCRGAVWADDVARQVGTARAWPDCRGKALAIAIRKIRDLSRDARAQEGLARHCWKRAGERWLELQGGAPVNGKGR